MSQVEIEEGIEWREKPVMHCKLNANSIEQHNSNLMITGKHRLSVRNYISYMKAGFILLSVSGCHSLERETVKHLNIYFHASFHVQNP